MNFLIPGLLIASFVVFFCITWWLVLKTRDDIFAVFYTLLFVYTIFTQFAYVFYPDVAVRALVYFGPELFYPYWQFVFLSFVAILFVFFALRYFTRKHSVSRN